MATMVATVDDDSAQSPALSGEGVGFPQECSDVHFPDDEPPTRRDTPQALRAVRHVPAPYEDACIDPVFDMSEHAQRAIERHEAHRQRIEALVVADRAAEQEGEGW